MPFVRSETALPASERPIIETVGPITAAGITLFIHLTPVSLTIIAITIYTSPANAAPIIMPTRPAFAEAAPAKAANIEPMKAKDEPRKTGLRNFVKRR